MIVECGRGHKNRVPDRPEPGKTSRCGHCKEPIHVVWGDAASGSVICRREFGVEDVDPRPEHFGLTQDQVSYFTKDIGEVYGVVGIIGASLGFLLWLGAQEYLWLFLVGGYVSGALLGYLIDQARIWDHQRSIRRNPSYPKFLRYEEGLKRYSEYLRAVRHDKDLKDIARENELRKQVKWWKKLDGRSCEKELAQVLEQRYEGRGWRVQHTGRSGDEGVDILLEDKVGKRIIVQVKCHRSYISPGLVRDLYGTLMHHRADEAWLIATSSFHSGAKDFAAGKPIRLLTIRDILEEKERTVQTIFAE